MLAKETDQPFSDKDWIYEIKWDGYRAISELKGTEVKLYSRNGNSFNASYPIVVDALKKMKLDAVIDGEIVVLDEQGRSNFQLLQFYRNDSAYPIAYYVFDLLELKGKNIGNLALTKRKELLEKLIPKNPVVKYSGHIEEKGIEFFKAAVKKNLEGIMAKKADSEYKPGVRTGAWLKIKNHKTTEAIIAGFTQPGGSRPHFGALVLGIYDHGKLKYMGHTGSGFNVPGLQEISRVLKPLIRKTSPFEERVITNMPVTWVKPILVCEIKYTEWTRDGRLRHPIFLRLRNDKKAGEVTLAAAKPISKKKSVKQNGKKREKRYRRK